MRSHPRRYSFFARGVCVAAPRRGRLAFWLHAHATEGHGVHSPFLYGFCREVLLPLKRSLRKKGRGDRRHENATRELTRLTEVYLSTHYPHARYSLVLTPRRDTPTWQAWQTAYLNHTGGVVVDLYVWGLLFTLEGIAPHRVGIRGFSGGAGVV